MSHVSRETSPTRATSPPVVRASLTLTLVLAGLGMFGPFNVDAPVPAFVTMASEFRVSAEQMQWVLGVYLLSFAVMSLFHGPVSDAVGRKPVMLGGIAVYVAASVGCALAPNLSVLLLFRALQGFSAGAGQIISRAVIRDLFDGAEARRLMSHVSMIFAVAPALAPIVGGLILRYTSWNGIFWFLALFGVVMAVSVIVRLPETLPPNQRQPLALRPVVSGLWRALSSAKFLRLSLAASLGFSAQFLYIANASPFITGLLGFGSDEFAVFFVPMVVAMMAGSALSSRLAHRVGMMRQAVYGLSICVVCAVIGVFIALSPLSGTMPASIISPVLVAFGMSLALPTLQLAMIECLPDARGAAASAGTFVNLLVGAAMASLVGPFVTGSLAKMAAASAIFAVTGASLLALDVVLRRRVWRRFER